MRSIRLLLVLALGSALALPAFAAPVNLEIWLEVGSDGAPGPLWLEILAARLPEREVAAAAALRRPLSRRERAWADAIRARLRFWGEQVAEIAAPFAPVAPPADVRIALGNRGGEDALTHDTTTIGFDLSRLADLYGDATSPENRERIDRLFDQEATHLMLTAWLSAHPQPGATPFERALRELWAEGLANYRSLPGRWRSTGGAYSKPARAALDDLEPILVARLTALACATPTEAARLTRDQSRGELEKRWGALPAALWLDAEANLTPDAVSRYVRDGVEGVAALAARRLPPLLAAPFEAARARSHGCPG